MSSQLPVTSVLSHDDYLSLKQARQRLEHPSFAIRLTNVIGTPIENGLALLPNTWYRNLHRAAEIAIWKALNVAASSLKNKKSESSHDTGYKLAGIVGGAVGGFFGGPALLLELPLTTTMMLRSIADIARSEGENLHEVGTRLACLEVFALGGRSRDDDAADAGYYGLRLALEVPLSNASRHIARHGLAKRAGTPMLVDFITTVSERFGIAVSEKAAAEFVPVIGALGGAFINGIFMQHFQDMARGHFTVRRLERKYGPRLIRAEYDKLDRTNGKLLYAAA
jgi:hypothetical protein